MREWLLAMECRPFHELQSPEVKVFLTTNRGWGVKAAQPISKGTFIVEYAGNSRRLSSPENAKPSLSLKAMRIATQRVTTVFIV